MADSELAVAPMYRIIKKAGAERVSEEAAKELAKVLECVGIGIVKEAIEHAGHAGRKTVRAEDIKISTRKVPPERGLAPEKMVRRKGPFCK